VKKSDVVQVILGTQYLQAPKNITGSAFAPTNIALCKYWGKRDQELNLPVTPSLSISLGKKGANATITVSDATHDEIILNDQLVNTDVPFSKRLISFLNLFRLSGTLAFTICITSNIPIAAGLASSAAGFASIVKALNGLYGWQLDTSSLSILARLGSGSASRSLYQGFVEWHKGVRKDGMDSFSEAIREIWPEFCIGLLIVSDKEKGVSSREAMQRTVATSALYSAWPQKVTTDLADIKIAIAEKDFNLLGKTAESNALTMHATLLSAWPPVNYAISETIQAMQKIWQLRNNGLEIYFTQDAGPNLKLLFLQKDLATIQTHFPTAEILQPFA
jgi:diphosphomevalonate decarboxylase